MKSNPLPLLLSIGLFLLPTTSLYAKLDSVLTLSMNCYFQSKESSSTNTLSGKVGNVRVNAKQLLAQIGKQNGVSFPRGSILMVADDGTVFVANSQRVFIADASAYLRIVFDREDELFQGNLNLTNGKEKSTTYYGMALKLNLANLQGTVRGLAIESKDVGPPKKTGVQITQGTTSSRISGQGAVNGGLGYYEGKIDLKGKTASTLE